MSFSKRAISAIFVSTLLLAGGLLNSDAAYAQISFSSRAMLRPVKLKYNQGQDQLIGQISNISYDAVFGEYSYNGQNLVYAGLENGGSFVKVIDNANSRTFTTPVGSLGVFGSAAFRVTIGNSGQDVALSGIYSTTNDLVHISGNSGQSWSAVNLPAVLHGGANYDSYITFSLGHSFGLGDVDFQPSMFYGNDGKLYIYTYQENSAAISDTARIALVEHVYTPGNLTTPASRVIFTLNIGSNCSNTAGRICYINAVPTDSGVLLIEGGGDVWAPPWPFNPKYAPRYAFMPYGSTGAVNSWGFIGDGNSSGVSMESIEQEEIAVSFMGVNAQNQEQFAFLRRKGNTLFGVNFGVSRLTLVDNAGVYSFQDTHPYPGAAYTSLNSAHLSASGISTTDLSPLLGGSVGSRTVRDIAANRYTGYVTTFLYGPPNAQTGAMEIDDITAVRFSPGNAVTPNMREFVNDYTAAHATNSGSSLYTNSIGFDVSSLPNGKIATFFTGNITPWTNPLWSGRIFYQIW